MTRIDAGGVNTGQSISNDGNVVVFQSTDPNTGLTQVLAHDRSTNTTLQVPNSGARNPTVSGHGCFVAYSTFTDVATAPRPVLSAPGGSGTADTSPSSMPASTLATAATTAVDTTTTEATTIPTTKVPATSEVPATSPPSSAATTSTTTTASTTSTTSTTTTTVPAAPSPTVSLYVYDRCAAPAAGSVLIAGPFDSPNPLGAPAVSLDGSVIAYSNGNDIVRLRGTVSGYAADATFDTGVTATPEQATGPNLDISADGSVIVFEAGPATAAAGLAPDRAVYVWQLIDGSTTTITPIATIAKNPSVSADGMLVAYEASNGSDAGFSGVVVHNRGVPGSAPANISIDQNGALADISANGNHVVYNTAGGMAMTSWVTDATTPFERIDTIDLSLNADGSRVGVAASGPVVAALGAAVAFDEKQPVGTAQPIAIRAVGASGAFSAASYDLGTGDVGATIRADVGFTNQGPASVMITSGSIVVESPFAIGSNGCLGSLRPKATCTVEVTLRIDALEDVFGSIRLTSGPVTAEADLFGIGRRATTTTDPATATTTSTTTPPANTTFTVNTSGSTTQNTTRNTTRTTTRTTTRDTVRVNVPDVTSSAATTTTQAPLLPSFSPAAFEFAPTIIDAGRRTASIEVVNVGQQADTVSNLRIEPASADFAIVDSTCADAPVGPGARCVVNLAFAPTAEGPLSATLNASLGSGSDLTAALTGFGAPAPTLSVVAEVATVGQVVTVSGAGFPSGSTVELNFLDGEDPRSIVVNDSGIFDIPLVVLTHTTAGPHVVVVTGQIDTFADVQTQFLVTKTSNRSAPGILAGPGPQISR